MKSLYTQLSEDWSILIFSIKLTEQEIVIKFPTQSQSLPPESALQKYMTRLCSHGNPSKWGLRKRGDRWCVLEMVGLNNNVTNALNGNGNGNGNGNESITTNDLQLDEPMLTFSYFLPWIKSGLRKVTQSSGHAVRNKIIQGRQKLQKEAAAMEEAFQLDQQMKLNAVAQTTLNKNENHRSSVYSSAPLQNRGSRRTQDLTSDMNRRRLESYSSNL